jgi:hypothetical protein
LTTTDAIRASVVVVVGGGGGVVRAEERRNNRDAVDVEFKLRSSLKRLHKKNG